MTASLSLAQMVDLALGTPEVGAVNFNVLHTLLHALLGKLDLQDHKANINEADKDFLSKTNTQKEKAKDGKDTLSNILRAPYHTLQDKLMKLEQQLAILNDLPSNNELLSKVKSRGDEDRYRPMTDLWQTMQISKRVGANEEGIGKLMSLVEDMMGEMERMREENSSLNKRIEELGDMKQFEEKFNQLEQSINDMRNQFSELPTDLVSWNALQDALHGIRDELAQQERVVIEMSSQTESRPVSGKRPVSRIGTPGPSNELMEVLEKLGNITDRHDVLEEKVSDLENEMKNKADITMLEGITGDVPTDFLDQLKDLQEQLNNLNKASEKENEGMTKMQQVLLELQAEMDRLNTTSQSLIDDAGKKQEAIKALANNFGNLEEKKADKEYVHMEVVEKADKAHLEGKVSRTLFNDTCDELNKMIKDLLDKLIGHEDDWKKALSLLSDDVDGKLDRLEFGPIKDQLERELRALSKKINQLSIVNYETGEDDAAGIRKQMLRFHCISCDRPVDMTAQGPIPSIPAPASLPASKSMRPYTTYELDAIRQQAKSFVRGTNITHLARAVLHRYRGRCGKNICNLFNRGCSCSSASCPVMPSTQEISDMYATTRACGGPHTMTYPHRRITRMNHINNLFKEDEVVPVASGTAPVPVIRDELEIQGADGHVYKGRIDTARLPNIPGTNHQGAPAARAQTTPSGGARPSPPPGHTSISGSRSPRPGSARISRPSSSVEKRRPSSAQRISLTEVPTGRDGSPAGAGSPEPPTE